MRKLLNIMGFKDLFIERIDEKPVAPAKATKEAPAAPVQVSPVSNTATKVNTQTSDMIVSQVWDAIKNENLPGPDYLELKSNASALEGMPLTEEQKIQTSFKILKNNFPAFNKNVILSSLDKYLEVVERERKVGLDQYETAKAEKVGVKVSEIERLNTEGDNILAKIENLKAEYTKIKDRIAILTQEVNTTNQELDSTKALFLNSVDSVVTVLNNDKDKINKINFE